MSCENDYFKTICRISRSLGSTTNRKDVLDLIVTSVVDAMKVKAACLFLFDEEEARFVPSAQKGLSENYLRYAFSNPDKLVPVFREEGYFFSHDIASDSRLEELGIKKTKDFASILAVPVVVKNKLIGGLSLFTASPRLFTRDEIDLAIAIAEQGGMAIEHVRLIEQSRKNTALFQDLAINLNSSLDMKKILHILTAEIAEAFKVKASSILLINEEKRTLEFVASYGLSETYLNRGPLYVEKSVDETLAGKPVAIKNVLEDRRVKHKQEKQKEGIVSILSIPIKTKENVIGVMRLYSGAPKEFTEDEVMLATALAYLGGLAIQNASHYLVLEKDMKDLEHDAWIQRSWF